MITLVKDAETIGESETTTIISGSDTGHEIHTFQANTNGSPTAVTLSIHGSVDGSKFKCLLQHEFLAQEIEAGAALFHLINKPLPVIKVSIDKLEGGISPQVSVYYFKGSVSR